MTSVGLLLTTFAAVGQKQANQSPDVICAILSAPDLSKKSGRRDAALLSLLYDSGARVQEISDLTVANIRMAPPAVVTLHGKGNKERCVPIMEKTARLLESYMNESKQASRQKSGSYLFLNHQKNQLGRKGIPISSLTTKLRLTISIGSNRARCPIPMPYS